MSEGQSKRRRDHISRVRLRVGNLGEEVSGEDRWLVRSGTLTYGLTLGGRRRRRNQSENVTSLNWNQMRFEDVIWDFWKLVFHGSSEEQHESKSYCPRFFFFFGKAVSFVLLSKIKKTQKKRLDSYIIDTLLAVLTG